MKKQLSLLLLAVSLLFSCNQEKPGGTLVTESFGEVNGQEVQLYTITFPGQLTAQVTNYGGIITSLQVPDRAGNLEHVVLGYDDLNSYQEGSYYFGALIGRFCNRIDQGIFELDGTSYELTANDGPNHLNGGREGFDKVVWEEVDQQINRDVISLTLQYLSPDGEEGYPGSLTGRVTYVFTPNALDITYQATTDKPTIVNLTQHTYFNLSGNAKEDVLEHELQLDATAFLPVDSTLIPTGEIRLVQTTPFDFTQPKLIGQDIDQDDQQILYGMGYDHCWILDGGITNTPRPVGSLFHPGSGRKMDIFTTEPALQVYSGNFLDGPIRGKDDQVYDTRYGLCLETQHYPDSPNQPDFPSVVLRPGEEYTSQTTYVFSVEE
jgi:aldose 1-epimerase